MLKLSTGIYHIKIAGRIVVLVVLLLLTGQVNAQLCEGNLGENIFTEGDFGSGVPNVLIPDPQIAPGYQYQTNPPPNDGFYTITNNTTSWGSFASAWVDTGDNSEDPYGYMMVVNASYTPGLFYEQQVDGLCENTFYVFSADVINLINPGNNSLKPNVSFLLDDVVYYNTGSIDEDGRWNTYGFTFTTGPGQTSIKLSLRNNAPGGLGNDLALDNIAFRACGDQAYILPEEIANICEDGEPIELAATVVGDIYDTPYVQWQQSFDEGETWYNIAGETGMTFLHTELAGGFYYYRFLLANGPANLLNVKCRVVSNVKVVHVIPKYYTIIDTLCEGLSFQLGDNLLDSAGIYTDSLLTSIGCDSIVTLELSFVKGDGLAADFDAVNPSCDYLDDGSIHIIEFYNMYSPLEILLNGIPSQTGSAAFQSEGILSYTITDRFGCRLDTTIELEDPPPFEVSLGDDLVIELGTWVSLIPMVTEPAHSFKWAPVEEIKCEPPCDELGFYPAESLTVIVEAISAANQCYDFDTIRIDVRTVRHVYFPNVFTPNFDGINDYFTPVGQVPNVQLIEELVIYDRWGNLVFENHRFPPNDPFRGWNGTYRGMTANPGVYTYLARVRFLDGEVEVFGGDVTLLR